MVWIDDTHLRTRADLGGIEQVTYGLEIVRPVGAAEPREQREASRMTAPLRTMARWLRRGS